MNLWDRIMRRSSKPVGFFGNGFLWTRRTQRNTLSWLGCIACLPFLLLQHQEQIAWSQSPDQQVADATSSEDLQKYIAQLTDRSYQTRQSAARQLLSAGEAAVPLLVEAIQGGDLELVDRASLILQDLATLETPVDDGKAWDALSQLQRIGPGAAASRAKSAQLAIQNDRSERARARLTAAGITCGIQHLTFNSRNDVFDMVRFPKDWEYDADALQWMPWMYSATMAVIEGEALRGEVLAAVAKLPALTQLQLADGHLDGTALRELAKLKRIDTLEIMFVSLGRDDEDLFALAELPLRQRLILIGTEFVQEDIDALRPNLKGLEIIFSRGGFLGVQCLPGGLVCMVEDVVPGSAAERAGLTRGDIILRLGGNPIVSFADLQATVRKFAPNEEIEMVFRRGTEERNTKVNLGRPNNVL
jgi:hypothetical protein